jgi:hypothetical protein
MSFFRHLFVHDWASILAPVAYRRHQAFRAERKCNVCGKKQISVEQFTPRVKKELIRKYNFESDTKWLSYEKDDALDAYTTLILTDQLDE